MKHILLLTGIFCIDIFPLKAQFLHTSYFMDGSVHRYYLNPGLLPERGYIHLPIIGGSNISISSNTLNQENILNIIKDIGEGDYSKNNNLFENLANVNDINLSSGINILSAGRFSGKNFWSFNIGIRTDMKASIPKGTFEFIREMSGINAESINWSEFKRSTGKEYFSANAYMEIGMGYTRIFSERLTIGSRIKLLSGIGNFDLQVENIEIKTDIKGISEPNIDWGHLNPKQIYKLSGKAQINVQAHLKSSAKCIELRQIEGSNHIEKILWNNKDIGIAGYGTAIDFGIAYKLPINLNISAALLDLGFISWMKKHTYTAHANSKELVFNFDEGDKTEQIAKINKFAEIVSKGEIINNDMLKLELDETSSSRTTPLNATMIFGAEYCMPGKKVKFGTLSTTRFSGFDTQTELTLSINFIPHSNFNMALSYSMIKHIGNSFGLAMKLGPLFLGTDYLYFGKNTKISNMFIGITIPLGKKISH